MDPNTFPTKGNLILAKNSLALAKQGYVLMDKKRNILIRELMGLIQQAESIQKEIDSTFRMAYAALQMANIKLGISLVEEISYSVPVEDSIRIRTRSIMGTEIPLVEADTRPAFPTYAYYSTNIALDQAKASFEKVKQLSIKLSMIENSAYRLANITIPRYTVLTKDTQNALEEKEREEFTRLKVIKRMQSKKA